MAKNMIPTHASYLADVARAAHQTGKDLTLDDVAAVIEAVNSLAAADDTLARTGNTARDQEMYAAGIRTGEENAKHNAAIRAGVPDGWKLVEALRESLLWTASSLAAVGKEQDLITLEGRKRTIGEILDEANAALNAPSPDCAAPGVSTVEDAQKPIKLVHLAVAEDGGVRFMTGRKLPDGIESCELYAMPDYGRAPAELFRAPAAGDALDAARYRWLCDKFGITKLPCAIERIIEGSYVPDGKAAIDAAIDTAIAAQQGKGGA